MAELGFINKMTASEYGSATKGAHSSVTLESDTGKLHYDGYNVEKPAGVCPDVGDALWVDSSGSKHFYKGDTVNHTALTAKGQTFVGVVAMRKGRKAWVLHKDESSEMRFTSCWAWEVTGLTYGSEQTIVFQQVKKTSPYGNVTVGTCTFTPSDIDDAVTKLNTWLTEHPGDTTVCFTYNWHCAKINGRIWIISDFTSPDYRQYTALHTTGTTDGVETKANMWELAGYVYIGSIGTRRPDGVTATSLNNQRADGKLGGSTLWNKSRAKQYMADNGNIGTPTDTNPDDSEGIYSEENFSSSNCPNTYSNYNGDYDAYLESKLLRYPASEGAMKVFAGDGRRVNAAMQAIEYVPLSGGNAVKMFTAVDYAKTRKAHSTASVAGLNAGDWYTPGYDEIFEIFKQMKADGSDRINRAFIQSNSSARNLSMYRWISARYDNANAWVLSYGGGMFHSGFYNSYARVCAVALLEFRP